MQHSKDFIETKNLILEIEGRLKSMGLEPYVGERLAFALERGELPWFRDNEGSPFQPASMRFDVECYDITSYFKHVFAAFNVTFKKTKFTRIIKSKGYSTYKQYVVAYKPIGECTDINLCTRTIAGFVNVIRYARLTRENKDLPYNFAQLEAKMVSTIFSVSREELAIMFKPVST